MFGFFKRNNFFPVTDGSERESEPKKDKRFIVVIIVFAATILLTVIRGLFDPEIASQLHTLKFSVLDGIMLAGSAGGYYYITKRGKK
ncbi:hypothetical protein [uncultured Ruminococcus sp.]|uniref:hypothetical protein n=1 Tax=uncultured Ruminococcus sp. TaxID=165186 RepID=UPI0025D3C8FC|nr:hypothetical protein [uncultured Ruminococcus sp.]